MLNKLVVSFCAMFFASIAMAQSDIESKEKLEAISVLKKHSETIACNTSFEEEKNLKNFIKNVFPIERDDSDFGSTVYYILWHGDIGCAGGSGTNSFAVSELSRFSKTRPFLVKNNNAFGEEFSKLVNLRFIEKIQQINNKKFVVTSSEYEKKDANNFPSNKYQYTVEQVNFKWKVTNKKYIGRN